MTIRPAPPYRLPYDTGGEATAPMFGLRVHGQEIGNGPARPAGPRLSLLQPDATAGHRLAGGRLGNEADELPALHPGARPAGIDRVGFVELALRVVCHVAKHAAPLLDQCVEVGECCATDAIAGHAPGTVPPYFSISDAGPLP